MAKEKKTIPKGATNSETESVLILKRGGRWEWIRKVDPRPLTPAELKEHGLTND